MGEIVPMEAFLRQAFDRYARAKQDFDANPSFEKAEACRKAFRDYVMIGVPVDARPALTESSRKVREQRS